MIHRGLTAFQQNLARAHIEHVFYQSSDTTDEWLLHPTKLPRPLTRGAMTSLELPPRSYTVIQLGRLRSQPPSRELRGR